MNNQDIEKYICGLEGYTEFIRDQHLSRFPINGRTVEDVLRKTIQFMRNYLLEKDPLLHDKGKVGDYIIWDAVLGEYEGKILRVENGYYVVEIQLKDSGCSTITLPFHGYNIRLKTQKTDQKEATDV